MSYEGRRKGKGEELGKGKGGGSGGKASGAKDGIRRGGNGLGFSDLGMADMWVCPQCHNNSFLSRRLCYSCRAPRPDRPRIKSEAWPRGLLGIGGGKPWSGAVDGAQGDRGIGEQRVPLLRWGENTAGSRLQNGAKGSVGKAGTGSLASEVQGKGRRDEEERAADEEDEEGWQRQRGGKRKQGNATRAKAAAGPPGAGTKEKKEEKEGERYEEVQVPPPYQPPLPRFFLASRLQALESKVGEWEGVEEVASKRQRAERCLEETKAQLKEAGGGAGTRGHFALVNSRKRIARLEKGMEKAHQELEEAQGRAHAALQDEKRAITKTEKIMRELENEKSKQAYLALQTAQEAGEQVHTFQGLREATSYVRTILQQTQRLDGVPPLDHICRMVEFLEPQKYDGSQDPVVLGLEVSAEEDEEKDDEDNPSSDDEEDPAQKGQKRRWERMDGRWVTAEDRDGEGQAKDTAQASSSSSATHPEASEVGHTPIVVDEKLAPEVERAQREVCKDVGQLQHVVEANNQIAMQETMQRQQEIEIEVRKAKEDVERRIAQGQAPPSGSLAPSKAKQFEPNPRLALKGRRRQASTPRARRKISTRWGEDTIYSRARSVEPGAMELEDEESRKDRRDRQRQESSRSPRGRHAV